MATPSAHDLCALTVVTPEACHIEVARRMVRLGLPLSVSLAMTPRDIVTLSDRHMKSRFFRAQLKFSWLSSPLFD